MVNTNAQQAKVMANIVDAVIEAVSVANPDIGAPGGVMYAALQAVMRLDQFEELMSGLVRYGLLDKSGHCYKLTERGVQWYQNRVA
jgi:hypothetical protein